MTYDELKKQADQFSAVLYLEDLITHQKRVLIRKGLVLLCLLIAIFIYVVHIHAFVELDILAPYLLKFRGLFFILLSLAIGLSMLEAFFYSFYTKASEKSKVSFDLISLLFSSPEHDITYQFLTSQYGWDIMDRLGVPTTDISTFLGSRKNILDITSVTYGLVGDSSQIDIASLTEALLKDDVEFSAFLFARNIQKEELLGASSWIEMMRVEKIFHEKWWQREALERIPGIAKNWAYGQTFILERYGYDLTESVGFKANGRLALVHDEVSKLENVLSRSREANAFIIGEDEDERQAIVESLAKRIHEGVAFPVLEHKRVFLINANSVVEHNPDKASFETEFAELLSQAVESGNTILVISQFPALLLSAKTFGSDISALMDPFLRSAGVQIVGLCDAISFHQYIESNTDLFQHFESIQITEKDNSHLMSLLQDEALNLEKATHAFFTYQSLETIIECTERYFAGLPKADKARDILFELIPQAAKHKNRTIGRKEVLELVEAKTGIPTGEVKDAEKEKLLHLEAVLHKRIVGQDEAISAISQSLRRARSDLRNHNKPIGSFLFLGPTGVGKTETSKALAEVFFGQSTPVVRLDMSEYTGADALEKLIGSFKDSHVGVLASALREHQYGILLLDEFEKAHTEVLNLFLQILDEGFFSDMRGVRVNARNLIIIATSNAGSDVIFDLVKQNKDLQASKEVIVNTIISKNIFKPELLNRFDGVIVFHPLSSNQLEDITRLALGHTADTLKKKGLELVITSDLVKFLISKGTDQTFGARPMNRAIAEEVEGVIAEEIIKGSLPKGSRIELVPDALTNKHLVVKIVS